MAARRNRTRTLLASGGALLVAFAVGGCSGTDASDAPAEKKSFALSGRTLTIEAENSVVRLVPADVKNIEVTRRIDGWVFGGSGPRGSWRMTGDTLSLAVRCRAIASDCEALHEVRVPRGVAVTVRGNNGRITATGFDTALKLRSDNGSLTVRDSSGPVDLESDNGRITAEGLSAGTVTAKSDNGAIRLGMSAVPDMVDTVSDNGRITIDLPASRTSYAVKASSDNGDVDVDVPKDPRSAHVVNARSDNGKITVRTVKGSG
ncbi:DUF4097 family beta strand repeat-containing protein [Streptomyces lushanensis]|uniref:DUF4097 family beta strand repeat-containing protein n=1 Tax=Streptomyces lushanensis TaxID=1434255 RepID=UPI00082AD3E4|nr:DUF4097 family beta strand repeat-containing protein [Streptomyces lushanensis]